MKVYQADLNGIFAGETEADPDPKNPGEWLIPNGCVLVAPPPFGDKQIPRLVNDVWQIAEDHRGEIWEYDGQLVEITGIGPIPPEFKQPSGPLPSFEGYADAVYLERVKSFKSNADRIDMVNRLTTATLAQISTYVDNNVTNIAQVRVIIKKILYILATTVKE